MAVPLPPGWVGMAEQGRTMAIKNPEPLNWRRNHKGDASDHQSFLCRSTWGEGVGLPYEGERVLREVLQVGLGD